MNYRKKGIKKSSLMSFFKPAQKNGSCNKDRHTLLYKGGWGSSPLRFRASGNKKKKKENKNLELNYKLNYIDTTKNIKGSLLQIRQLGGGCVRLDAFFERVAFFCSLFFLSLPYYFGLSRKTLVQGQFLCEFGSTDGLSECLSAYA